MNKWRILFDLFSKYLVDKDGTGQRRHPFRSVLAWVMLLTFGMGFVADNHSDIMLAPDADLLQVNEHLVRQNKYLKAQIDVMIDLAAKISDNNERLEYFNTVIETEQTADHMTRGGK